MTGGHDRWRFRPTGVTVSGSLRRRVGAAGVTDGSGCETARHNPEMTGDIFAVCRSLTPVYRWKSFLAECEIGNFGST